MCEVDRRAVDAVKAAKAKAGAGWSLLGQELREGLVAREILNIIIANEENDGYQKAAALAFAAMNEIN